MSRTHSHRPSPRRSLASRRGPPPLFLFGLAAFLGLSLIAHHPVFAFAGLLWFGSRMARRRRWSRSSRGGERWDTPVSDEEPWEGPATSSRQPRREPEAPASSMKAWSAAREAVQSSTALSPADRERMLTTLDAGLAAVRDLQAALVRMHGDAEPRLDSVAAAAAARAARFEADCATLRRAVAALEIQSGEHSALHALGAAADELAGQVDARRELDALGAR